MSFDNFDSLFDDEQQEQMFQETQQKFQEKRTEFKQDESMFFPSLGKNGEENVVTGRLIPTNPEFDKSTEFGRVWLAKKKQHKFTEGTEEFKETCLKTLEYYYTVETVDQIPEGIKWKIVEYTEDGVKKKKVVVQCPCCEDNPWPGRDDKEKYDNYSRKKGKAHAWVNFLVEEDLLYPENNGKLKRLYLNGVLLPIVEKFMNGHKVGKKVMTPKKNPFKLSGECYQFLIIMSKDGQFTNYKESKFIEATALTRKENEELLKQTNDIAQTIRHKTYDELKAKLKAYYSDEDPEAYKKIEEENKFEENAKNFNSKLEKEIEKRDEENEKALDEFSAEIKKTEPKKVDKKAPKAEEIDVDFDEYF